MKYNKKKTYEKYEESQRKVFLQTNNKLSEIFDVNKNARMRQG